MTAIQAHPLALTLPYLAFTPVFMALTGWLILGETLTPAGTGGIVLVAAGAYLLNVDARRQAWWAPLGRMWRERGARLMLGTALIYSVTAVMGKGVLQFVTAGFFAALYFSVLALVALGMLLIHAPRDTGALLQRPHVHLAIGLLLGMSMLAHLTGIQQIEAAYMIAVKRSSLLFGILYGYLLFRAELQINSTKFPINNDKCLKGIKNCVYYTQ